MSTLIFKLGTALLKQVTKPMANALTASIMRTKHLRGQVVSGAQVVHRWNVWLRNVGEEKKVIVGKMTEAKALDLATSMLTETIIYASAAGLTYWEYQRSTLASLKKKEEEKRLTAELRAEAASQRQLLFKQNEEQTVALTELRKRIEDLEGRRSWWRAANKGSVVQHLPPPDVSPAQ